MKASRIGIEQKLQKLLNDAIQESSKLCDDSQKLTNNGLPLSDMEQQILVSEVIRFANANSTKEQSEFVIDNKCKLAIFKIIAPLVDHR